MVVWGDGEMSEVHMAEPESQHPRRWRLAGWAGVRGSGIPEDLGFPLNTGRDYSMFVIPLRFFSVVWKKGPFLFPETNTAQLDACPCYRSFFSCFCHGDRLFGPASP